MSQSRTWLVVAVFGVASKTSYGDVNSSESCKISLPYDMIVQDCAKLELMTVPFNLNSSTGVRAFGRAIQAPVD